MKIHRNVIIKVWLTKCHCLSNDLASNWRQTIICHNVDQYLWHHMASLERVRHHSLAGCKPKISPACCHVEETPLPRVHVVCFHIKGLPALHLSLYLHYYVLKCSISHSYYVIHHTSPVCFPFLLSNKHTEVIWASWNVDYWFQIAQHWRTFKTMFSSSVSWFRRCNDRNPALGTFATDPLQWLFTFHEHTCSNHHPTWAPLTWLCMIDLIYQSFLPSECNCISLFFYLLKPFPQT